jgi:hypothetical protein
VAVAVIGLAMLGVQPLPDRLAMVIAGLAALPLCLAVAAPVGARLPGTFRWAVLAGYLLLVPAVAVTNKVVLARLSAMPSPAQLAVAVVEPLVWTAGIVVAATAVPAAGRRVAAVLGGGAPRCDVE